jgi:hypothetical protein
MPIRRDRLRPLPPAEEDLQKIQRNLVDALNILRDDASIAVEDLEKQALSKAKLITVAIGTAATQVPHWLGYRPNGWIVVRSTVNTNVWESTTQPASETEAINLQAGTAGTFTLLVF